MVKLSSIKQQMLYVVHNFLGQKFRKGSAGQLSVGVSHAVPVRCWLEMASSTGWTHRAGSPQELLTEHLHTPPPVQQPQSTDFSHGNWPPQRVSSSRGPGGSCTAFSDWALKGKSYRFSHLIGQSSNKLSQIQEEAHRTPPLNERNVKTIWGPNFKTSHTYCVSIFFKIYYVKIECIKQFVWFAIICVKKELRMCVYVYVCTFTRKEHLRGASQETSLTGASWGEAGRAGG